MIPDSFLGTVMVMEPKGVKMASIMLILVNT